MNYIPKAYIAVAPGAVKDKIIYDRWKDEESNNIKSRNIFNY